MRLDWVVRGVCVCESGVWGFFPSTHSFGHTVRYALLFPPSASAMVCPTRPVSAERAPASGKAARTLRWTKDGAAKGRWTPRAMCEWGRMVCE